MLLVCLVRASDLKPRNHWQEFLHAHRLISLGFALMLPVVASAALLKEQPLSAEPTGPVILTMSGNIEGVGSGTVVRLDRAMLEGLGTTTLKTTTVWTSGEVEFEGVLVRDVLHALGAQGPKWWRRRSTTTWRPSRCRNCISTPSC